MDDREALERRAVAVEALTWPGTPYHHRGNVKGRNGGVDCARILIEVFAAVGLIEWFDPGNYPADWHLHRSEERYLAWIERFGAEVRRDPIEGDILVFQHGRTFSHGAICVGWPNVVHAYAEARVVEETSVRGGPLAMYKTGKPRPFKVYSFWDPRP